MYRHLKFKKLHPEAKLPSYQSVRAAGMDLYWLSDYRTALYPGFTIKLRTGLAVEIPAGYEGQVRGRSSLSAKGLSVALGTIDSDYRGEISVVMSNVSNEVEWIQPGDRIAQLVVAQVAQMILLEVDELSETARGTGGFGSTGK